MKPEGVAGSMCVSRVSMHVSMERCLSGYLLVVYCSYFLLLMYVSLLHRISSIIVLTVLFICYLQKQIVVILRLLLSS